MMQQILLALRKEIHAAIWAHLLPKRRRFSEQVAFVYAHREIQEKADIFRCVEWFPVPPSGFLERSGFHLELTDDTRASVIKRAHDLGASIAEFHSHVGSRPAQFSPSDLLGLEEFVPHVLWRLKGRPYLAVVVSLSGFDALVWITDPKVAHRLDGILVSETVLEPTRLSLLCSKDSYEFHIE
jgi:hypothetical protein